MAFLADPFASQILEKYRNFGLFDLMLAMHSSFIMAVGRIP